MHLLKICGFFCDLEIFNIRREYILDIKFLDDLENKVQSLITMLDAVRKENDRLKQELADTGSKISTMEIENNQLKQELNSLKSDTIDHKSKLDSVAERIQGILVRLESVN